MRALRRCWPLLLLAATACGGEQQQVLIPGPETLATRAIPPQPYVVRMSDGQRDWEVELPESARGYEVRIPLRPDPDPEGGLVDMPTSLTAADRELLTELRRERPSLEPEGAFSGDRDLLQEAATPDAAEEARSATERTDGEPTVSGPEDPPADPSAAAPSRPSYLLGVEEVRRLYRSGHPELALVRLERLLSAYPADTRLLTMKGTLWLRLGRQELARRAWEEVLQREPGNQVVQEALRRLRESYAEDDGEDGTP